MSSRVLCLAVGFALLSLSGAARAGAPAPPLVEWSFWMYLSDGSGGIGPGQLILEDSNDQGGGVEFGVELGPGGGSDPEADIFFSGGAADFWAVVRSPQAPVVTQGTILGGRSEISVSRAFRKDAADATLTFTIPDSQLSVVGANVPGTEGLSAIVVHSFVAGGFYAFFEEARLSGNAGAYTFTNGTGVLPYEIVSGGLDQAGVAFELSQAFVQDVDLSSLLVGEEFTVTYHVIADAVDTVQAEGTRAIAAGGVDLAADSDGVTLETDGLTALPVPDAGAALLLAAGGFALAATRGARRRAAA